ncbi:MAG: DUF4831 family protein [Bacteroidales bacterium]
MKYGIKPLVFILALAASASCATNKMPESKNLITPLSGKTTIADGSLVYSLPVTVLDITIETERVIEKPGPYARFAEALLGLQDVIQNEKEYWTIRGVSIKSHEEPDPSEFYVIEATALFQTNVLSLKKAGLMLDLNPEIFNVEDRNQTGGSDLNHMRISDLGSDEYFQTRSDTLYRLVSVDTTFIKIPYLVEKKQKLTIGDLAEKAAVRLMEMRDGKHMILTGETNVFPQDASSIIEMNRLEKDYSELFTGKVWKETRKFSYQLIPKKATDAGSVTICGFSESAGPVAASDKSGTPLVVEFIPEAKTKGLTLITRNQTDPSKQKFDKLYYRMPDVVNLKITYGKEIFKTSRQMIYQFGETIQLPSNYIIGR